MTGKPASGVRRGACWSRRLRAGVCALLLGFQTGCYTYLPIQSDPPQGIDRVGVILNDRGRVQMGPVLGPAVDMVEGVVSQQDASSIRVLVARVTTVRGEASTWTGEAVEIPRDGIAGFRGRQLSKARSWLLAGVVIGAIAYTAIALGLDGLGGSGGDTPCTGPTCDPNPSIRW